MPPADTVLGRFETEIFRTRGLQPPRIAVVTPSLQMRMSLMTHGPQLSLLPSVMLRLSGSLHRIAPLQLPLPDTERPVALMTLKGRTVSPVLEKFLQKLRQTIASIRKI